MAPKNTDSRRIEPRKWSALTMAGAAVGLVVSTQDATADGRWPQQEQLWLIQASGEGGEGGEGGEAGASTVESGNDVIDLLVKLSQIEGHIRSGQALYDAGDPDSAVHMGHPKQEIYESIEDELQEHGIPAFEAELDALNAAYAEGKPTDEIHSAHESVAAALERARSALDAKPKDRVMALSHLLRSAGEEFGEGVKDGSVVELEEYQDAWGFVQAVSDELGRLSGDSDPDVVAAVEKSRAAVDALIAGLPGISPDGPVDTGTDAFFATAASLELAAYGIR